MERGRVMNIILLSGGSGKRLWPLSNDVRSKQFIKLFKDEVGEYESMVQRVYRQIRAVDNNAKITIATSKSQASAIKNQLGDKTSICVEPCRRDTFPAILLAATYLHDELGVSAEEAVAVCPVDPYVDHTYYEAVGKLEKIVHMKSANLTLMGVEPTYPSEKYGYIIPESSDAISWVKEFKEKPDTEKAKEYLKQNALWNAGVFAFRLGYLLEKAHAIVDFTDYRDLYSKYETLTKTSFDYAVVEKEPSIQVMRYNGDWKDVGTWNMMAEVMADDIKGTAVMDDSCKNTHIVNELNIPIIAMGCKDMVITASGDGILVTDKERSGYMKAYVEKVRSAAMFAEKSWGTYTVMDAQPGSIIVKVSMPAGNQMSYHSHEYREEVWTVISGNGITVVDGMEQLVRAGDVLTIAAGCKHTVKATTKLDILEVQLGDSISVEDKIKYEISNIFLENANGDHEAYTCR
jgi:mannose-1-phosphate guanylyltransferase